ncbi:hypothetical protein FWF74_01410 [Candidatus Saccharibacteria bacterium]|nr:hypothetical protein [Candidatus Saccharibacteria bacterium]MCL1963109.1 hypothetical protein [Candidatus Saccharibacteria bacterium]
MAEESVIGAIKKEENAKAKKKLPQTLVVVLNAFSVVFAAELGILTVTIAIIYLISGVGGGLAFGPFELSLVAAAFAVIALLTMKKITDAGMMKKAYGVAAIILIVQAICVAVAAVAVIPFALFAAGAGGAVQKSLWLGSFLPSLGVTAVVVGLLFVVKKIYDGVIKILPIVTYVILGIAGLAFILSTISTFIGFYGKNPCESYSNFDSYSEYIKQCSGIDLDI